MRYDKQEEEIRAKLVEDVIAELEKIEALEKKKSSIMRSTTGGSSSSSENSEQVIRFFFLISREALTTEIQQG